jgi:hypothetical protein
MAQTYSCNDADLYLGIQNLCSSGEEHQATLFNKKTIYSAAYFKQWQAEVLIARDLPDAISNSDKSKTARNTLVEQKNELLGEYQCFKSFVEELFDKKLWSDKLDLAGQGFYKAASAQDWTGLDNLMTKSTNFITENEAQLLAKGGMPPDFKDNYAQVVTDTRAMRNAFIQKKQGVGTSNLTKKSANDALYEKVTKLCRDAKRIFAKDPLIASKFVWDNILNAIGSTTGSTASQRRKTNNEKQKEKAKFHASLLGITVEDYVKMQKEQKKADKKVKKKGKKDKSPRESEVVHLAVPMLPSPTTP